MRETVIQLRCSKEEKAQWQQAADVMRMPLSAWVRMVLQGAATSARRVDG